MPTPRCIPYPRAIAIGTLLAAASAGGCRYVVTQNDTTDPVTVYIADHGRHASLVLAQPQGSGMLEFAYGEWEWYAKGNEQWYRVPGVLFLPNQGALGRQQLALQPDAASLQSALGLEAALPLKVERSRATALVERLDARHHAAASTAHYNPTYGLTFVHDPESYCILHNCNGQVAAWLRELGADVSGWSLDANFVVRTAAPSPP